MTSIYAIHGRSRRGDPFAARVVATSECRGDQGQEEDAAVPSLGSTGGTPRDDATGRRRQGEPMGPIQ